MERVNKILIILLFFILSNNSCVNNSSKDIQRNKNELINNQVKKFIEKYNYKEIGKILYHDKIDLNDDNIFEDLFIILTRFKEQIRVLIFNNKELIDEIYFYVGYDIKILDVKYIDIFPGRKKDILFEYSETKLGMTNPVFHFLITIANINKKHLLVFNEYFYIKEMVFTNNKSMTNITKWNYEIIKGITPKIIFRGTTKEIKDRVFVWNDQELNFKER